MDSSPQAYYVADSTPQTYYVVQEAPNYFPLKIEAFMSEFVGTFFLVLTVGYNVLQHTALAPVSVGAMLMAMVFATGKVSGAHFNPAVTFGVFLRGKLDAHHAILYVGCQLIGGFLAGIAYSAILGATFTLGPGRGHTLMAAFLVEVLFTAALVFVVLSVATTTQDHDNWYFGLAIGFTVMAAAFAIGPISGCALNPAVVIGVMLSHLMHTGHISTAYMIFYTVASLLGASLAVLLFGIVRKAEYDVPDSTSAQNKDLEYIAGSLEPQLFQGEYDKSSGQLTVKGRTPRDPTSGAGSMVLMH